MKNKILSIIILCALILGGTSCQSPEELTSPISRKGINSITASFPHDESVENKFVGEIDYVNHVITFVFPYYYPMGSTDILPIDKIKKMRIKANLDDNVTISPALLFLDLSQENYITVTNQSKEKVSYKIVGDIRRSKECEITKYDIPSLSLSGVIDNDKKEIKLVTIETIGKALAEFTISHYATISPDPSVEALDYDSEPTVTVTAQNGTDKAVYKIVKGTPAKVDLGMRKGSMKVLWEQKFKKIGLNGNTNMETTGIAALSDYLVLNVRGQNNIYLNAKTGALVGTMDNMGSIVGKNTNSYATADDANHILVCNLTPEAGATFKVWKINGVKGAVEPLISFDTNLPLGRKLSVIGDIDKNAIITAAISWGKRFARWQITDGKLVSQTPDVITINGNITNDWGPNADVIYTNEKSVSSDYFVAYYQPPMLFSCCDGVSNTVKILAPPLETPNFIPNAVAYAVFNKVPYVMHNEVNSFPWGHSDIVFMYDFGSSMLSKSTLTMLCKPDTYGSKEFGIENKEGLGDVAFKVSDNGCYLYAYFMFTGGYIVCVQFDCFDM